MPVDNPNVGVAFALVCGAGAATALGASVVFFPSLVKLASRRVLAGALGISAGVMTYVSFIEIFQKSQESFLDAGHSDENAYLYATLCFFGGVIFMMLVDFGVKLLSGGHGHSHDHPSDHHHTAEDGVAVGMDAEPEVEVVTPHCMACSKDPVGELDEWHHKAEEEEAEVDLMKKVADPTMDPQLASSSEISAKDDFNDDATSVGNKPVNTADPLSIEDVEPDVDTERENKKLVRMGINTALAIGLHNFPEGLATFVAALDDPRVGGVLAVAIGIHNIPEGLCVSLPIYYATGNRWKAFLWACISGIAEPIAALLGWAVLANSFSDGLYAVLFGLVGGMMVIISMKELIPTAHRYDPEDTVITYSFIAGMMIMSLSLVLFVF